MDKLGNEDEQIIFTNMKNLGLDAAKYKQANSNTSTVSFVLINPPNDFRLKSGDIVYLLRPGDILYNKI
jgi:hypothetical protein